MGSGQSKIGGVDYFTFDLDIDVINAGDNQLALATTFTGAPGTEQVLWRVSCTDGTFPSEGFGQLEVRFT
ncbi:MAG: hypothetical protein JO098_06820 [Candidatus Eremiobacteraeota bacterium]|nr:hypothetical protein [Candidatus Eremiobacteraeota bacterium]